MATRQEICRCLSEAKRLINENQYTFVERDKNNRELLKLSLTVLDAKDIVYGLLPTNYFRGPSEEKDDRFPSGDVWEFKKQYGGTLIYIKYKFIDIRDGKKLIILGFHEDK